MDAKDPEQPHDAEEQSRGPIAARLPGSLRMCSNHNAQIYRVEGVNRGTEKRDSPGGPEVDARG